jgi:uncharacterized protein (DUF983 family)
MCGAAARTPASKNRDSFPRIAGIDRAAGFATQRITRRAGATRSLTGPASDVVIRGYEMAERRITALSGAIGAGLSCACPRCGKGGLFQGFLTLRPRCEHCGLDYAFADSGDGPAVFVMFFAGAVVVGAALITEILFHPPYWVHAALWLPLILVVTLGPLRPMKGLMIALQYHHQAAESRFGGEQS